MIEYIKGIVTELTPTAAVVECAGIGYEVHVTLYTFSRIQVDTSVKLYTYESIREDAHLLFGFIDKHERQLFLLLISVSGVGANTARMILSSLSPQEVEQVIASENVSMLKMVKGIGLKTAQRIIVDLKDKINVVGGTLYTQSAPNSHTHDEAIAALVMLGFPSAAAGKAVQKLLAEKPTLRVEEVIKAALKML